jgi:hypothetical protein
LVESGNQRTSLITGVLDVAENLAIALGIGRSPELRETKTETA